jgi:hypothetical protein
MAAWSYAYLPPGSIRATLIVTPVLPALLIVAVAYWIYLACDEFIRLTLLKRAVITAITVSFCTLGYFLLELFGFFNLHMVFVIIRSR